MTYLDVWRSGMFSEEPQVSLCVLRLTSLIHAVERGTAPAVWLCYEGLFKRLGRLPVWAVLPEGGDRCSHLANCQLRFCSFDKNIEHTSCSNVAWQLYAWYTLWHLGTTVHPSFASMNDPSHSCHTPWCGLLPVWVGRVLLSRRHFDVLNCCSPTYMIMVLFGMGLINNINTKV